MSQRKIKVKIANKVDDSMMPLIQPLRVFVDAHVFEGHLIHVVANRHGHVYAYVCGTCSDPRQAIKSLGDCFEGAGCLVDCPDKPH
ncbi:MAG TPA: hypothetical protein VIE89_20980 [Candidatus Binatia bacterium]|jgi:hypothetical protein